MLQNWSHLFSVDERDVHFRADVPESNARLFLHTCMAPRESMTYLIVPLADKMLIPPKGEPSA